MPTPTCTKCRLTITSDDINVAQDVAYCRICNASYRLSDLTFDNTATDVDLNQPPKGAWCVTDGAGTVIGASNQNLVNAVGFTFFAIFWNSGVSMFVFFDIVGALHHFKVPLPTWITIPKMEDGGEMSGSMIMFTGLFIIPFVLVGLFLAGSVLINLLGRTEARISGTQGSVFTGVGKLGWRRRFDPSQLREVRCYQRRNNEGADTVGIQIETRDSKQVKFATMLTSERRQFMLGALKKILLK